MEKSTLEALSKARNTALTSLDGAKLTSLEQQQEAAQYLAKLDCLSVISAADTALKNIKQAVTTSSIGTEDGEPAQKPQDEEM